MGDGDALTRLVKFYTTAKRLYNKAQGRFSAPWVHGAHHAFPTAKRLHNMAAFNRVCIGTMHIRCKTSLRFGWGICPGPRVR